MTAPEMLAAVAAHPFAEGFSAGQVEAVAAGASVVDLEPWDVLFHEGGPADRAYLVLDGHVGLEVHVPQRGPVVVGSVGPGELLGWSWRLEPARWRFDARARTSCRLVALDAAALSAACAADPELDRLVSHQVTTTLALRLEAARHLIVDVYGRDR